MVQVGIVPIALQRLEDSSLAVNVAAQKLLAAVSADGM